ncbi:MAG: hypothetical protein IPI07_02185 [Flavobacteriales bacterium]|nr:hypothetical protein [Flavobacteriales bacterium]MBK7752808.1 hypothetical protein [Flavobacteriales bacterium]
MSTTNDNKKGASNTGTASKAGSPTNKTTNGRNGTEEKEQQKGAASSTSAKATGKRDGDKNDRNTKNK